MQQMQPKDAANATSIPTAFVPRALLLPNPALRLRHLQQVVCPASHCIATNTSSQCLTTAPGFVPAPAKAHKLFFSPTSFSFNLKDFRIRNKCHATLACRSIEADCDPGPGIVEESPLVPEPNSRVRLGVVGCVRGLGDDLHPVPWLGSLDSANEMASKGRRLSVCSLTDWLSDWLRYARPLATSHLLYKGIRLCIRAKIGRHVDCFAYQQAKDLDGFSAWSKFDV